MAVNICCVLAHTGLGLLAIGFALQLTINAFA